jgi:Tfp pilus assembly protein PilV
MLMMTSDTRRRGFLMTELIVGTALLGVALAGLAVSLQGASMFNQYQWTRQRCVAAAEAQLDSLAATGGPIEETRMKSLWPDVDVAMDTMIGEAAWEGLEMVRVTATGKAGPRVVTVRLERYFPRDKR